MAEFQWPDAVMLQMLAEVAPFLEQFDGRTLVVLKRKHRANAGNGIVAQVAFEAVLFERAGEFAEIRMRRDLERQAGAALGGGLVDLHGEQPNLAREVRAILLALGQNESDDLGVIIDHPLHIGRFERSVADAPGLDHRFSPTAAWFCFGVNQPLCWGRDKAASRLPE